MTRTVGHVDPSIAPSSKRLADVLAAIRTHGLNLHRVHRDGRSLRLTGPGVHFVVSDLQSLGLADLRPPTDAELKAQARRLWARG